MDIRILQYFLALTREESILGAASALHISQPSLSRQLRELEEELGKTLFLRSNRHITLTEDGMLLKKRAEEIVSLMQKTTSEIMQSDAHIAGDIYIGSGETNNIHYVLEAAKSLQTKHPYITFHIISGDRKSVIDDLDNGLIDFGILFGSVDPSKYETLEIPEAETIGVLMRKDDPLASKERISTDDLKNQPLILSRQMYEVDQLSSFLNMSDEELKIAGTYNLLYNGSIMVQNNMGYAICFDKIINTSKDSPFTFRPLNIAFAQHPVLVWKKYQIFSKAARTFKDEVFSFLQGKE